LAAGVTFTTAGNCLNYHSLQVWLTPTKSSIRQHQASACRVVYLGAETGRDSGVGRGSPSAGFGDTIEEKPTVQVMTILREKNACLRQRSLEHGVWRGYFHSEHGHGGLIFGR
jgi:hypothetical protein